jgi:phosphoribosylamine--glycine ligase
MLRQRHGTFASDMFKLAHISDVHLPLAGAQDHKRAFDNDEGPNTGGMGAYTPAPVLTPELEARVMREIIEPTAVAMRETGSPFVGVLYAGLMIDASGNPRVLEYNCRFGDPETQPILMRLRSDLVELCEAALAGKLDNYHAVWDPRFALGVVMVAEGYPGDYARGDQISGLKQAQSDNIKVFHAGTRQDEDHIVTDGGRVLCITALGKTVREAQDLAYQTVNTINWRGAAWRPDIGWRAVKRHDTHST